MIPVAVVVCTRNRPHLIGPCIDTILACHYQPAEIIVIDQSDDDQTLQAISARDKKLIRILRMPPVGLSAARNLGIAHTNAPLIAFTDDDCIADSDWLGAAVAELSADQSLAAVFGRVLPYTESEALGRSRPIGIKDSTSREVFAWPVNPWKLGHGANMIYRRTTFEQIGGFDPLLCTGGILYSSDDADMSYRVLRAGGRIAYAPTAVIYHRQWRFSKEVWHLERAYNLGGGAFYTKHLRYGDWFVLRLIYDRVWTVGLRHIALGLWTRKRARIRLGLYRVVYTFLGMLLGLRYRQERLYRCYCAKSVEEKVVTSVQ